MQTSVCAIPTVASAKKPANEMRVRFSDDAKRATKFDVPGIVRSRTMPPSPVGVAAPSTVGGSVTKTMGPVDSTEYDEPSPVGSDSSSMPKRRARSTCSAGDEPDERSGRCAMMMDATIVPAAGTYEISSSSQRSSSSSPR